MKPFTYERVVDAREAGAAVLRANAKFISGGTNLLDLMKLEIEQPAHLVDISQLPLNRLEDLPSGGLSGDTSYTVRTQQPAEYQMSAKQYAGDMVHVASDSSTSSVVAFWPHGSYLATISISAGTDAPSGDNNADELNSLQPLLNAWQWQ